MRKTAFVMRISDGSSDVCSSDLTESGLGPRPMPGSKERAIRPDRASVGTGRVQRVRDDLPVQVRENCCPQTDAGVSACVRARPCGHARIVVRPLGYYDEARPANIHIVSLVIVGCGRSRHHLLKSNDATKNK